MKIQLRVESRATRTGRPWSVARRPSAVGSQPLARASSQRFPAERQLSSGRQRCAPAVGTCVVSRNAASASAAARTAPTADHQIIDRLPARGSRRLRRAFSLHPGALSAGPSEPLSVPVRACCCSDTTPPSGTAATPGDRRRGQGRRTRQTAVLTGLSTPRPSVSRDGSTRFH